MTPSFVSLATRTHSPYANVTGVSPFGSSPPRAATRQKPSSPLNATAGHSNGARPTVTRVIAAAVIVTPVASRPFAALNARTNEQTSRANATGDSTRRAARPSLANPPFSTDSNARPASPSSSPALATSVEIIDATRAWHAKSREVYIRETNAAKESSRCASSAMASAAAGAA